ncbi:MAG: TrkA C-terminal domain-containing protein, partial [Bacteroidales bacterium]|nr:TrkA C-terminal domain-containing protein [Bacteroidales bacterium]
IATLGNSLGVMEAYIYPVIVAVSVITTFTTPYCIKLADPLAEGIERLLPASWKARLLHHQSRSHTVNQESEWRKLLSTYIKNMLLYGVILVAILLAAFQWLNPFVWKHLGELLSPFLIGCINAGITILVMAPFLRGLMHQTRQSGESYQQLWHNSRFNRSGLIAMVLLKVFMVFFFVMSVLFKNFKYSPWVMLLFAIAIIVFITFSEKTLKRYSRIEKRFQLNLNQKEALEQQEHPMEYSYNAQFAGNDIHMEGIRVSADTPYIGQTIAEADFRRKFGINIVKIKRGNHSITLPSAQERIYPYDKLLVLGSDAQITAFMKEIQFEDVEAQQTARLKNVGFYSFVIEQDSPFIGKPIFETNFRELGFMVIGIEHNGLKTMNPEASTRLSLNDVVWVAGERKNLYKLLGKQG